MSSPADASRPQTHVVAVLQDGSLWCSADGRIPRLQADWPDLAELVPGRTDLVVVAPARRLDPETTVRVLATRDTGGPGVPGWDRLVPLASLRAADGLSEPTAVIDVVEEAAGQWTGARSRPPRRQPWYDAHWLSEVTSWVDDQLQQDGLRRLDDGVVVRTWPLSALVRYAVSAAEAADADADADAESSAPRAVVLKAACEHFAAEPGLTAVLSELAPRHTPKVLGVDPARRLLLMEAFAPGPGSGEPIPLDPAVLEATVRAAAELQVAATGALGRLRSAGAPDRGELATLAGLHEVLTSGFELHHLDADEQAAAAELEPMLAERVRALFATGLPDTVSHGDLHSGNVGTRGAGTTPQDPVLYDWSDAAIGHPALDLAHLTGWLGKDAPTSQVDQLWEIWGRVWGAACPECRPLPGSRAGAGGQPDLPDDLLRGDLPVDGAGHQRRHGRGAVGDDPRPPRRTRRRCQ